MAPINLNKLPLFTASEFGRLDQHVLSALDRIAQIRVIENNELIYLQEDEADYLYFVRTGHVRLSYLLEDGSATFFAVTPPGNSFGELGIFEGGQNYDMATSIGTSSIYCVPAGAFRALASRFPQLDHALAQTIATRYRSYIALTRILGLKSLTGRLSQCLLRIADSLGDRASFCGKNVPRIGSFITQSDLGLMARGARGNVNRALKAWEKDKMIAIQDRSILILDRAGLNALATSDDL